MMNKKGISPLVATILLIAFAIALGLVVMNWGKSYIEEKAEFTAGPSDVSGCGLVELSVIQVSGRDKICYNPNDNSIEVFLENGPDATITDLQVRIVGSQGIRTLESVLDKALDQGVSAQVRFNYPSGLGDVQQVKLTPVIGGDAVCSKQAVVSENLIQC
jgi:flagellin-like protein